MLKIKSRFTNTKFEFMRYFLSFCIFSSLVILNSCKRQVIPPDEIDLGKDYISLQAGHFIEYEVDSIIYNDFNLSTDTFKTEFRDMIGSEFNDNEGRPSVIINRSSRSSSTSEWKDILTYYATLTNFKYEVIEDNLRFIKLVFPVKLNTRWYGNTYIPTALNPEFQWYDKWDYRYANVSEGYSNGVLFFPSTVTINQANVIEGNPDDADSYSAKTYAQEVYAKGVGLVYKELTRWVYQPSVVKYKKGFTLIMRAKNFN